MTGFTPFTLEDTLRRIKDECWVSLHFDDPELAGEYASEITGGGYGRAQASFGPISNNAMWLTNDLEWKGLPQNRIAYLGGWNQEHKGHLQWSALLNPPARILEGHKYNVREGTLALSFG